MSDEEEIEENLDSDESIVENDPITNDDSTHTLSVSDYLNPPERKWVLQVFIGMVVVFFGYYWFTYLGTL